MGCLRWLIVQTGRFVTRYQTPGIVHLQNACVEVTKRWADPDEADGITIEYFRIESVIYPHAKQFSSQAAFGKLCETGR